MKSKPRLLPTTADPSSKIASLEHITSLDLSIKFPILSKDVQLFNILYLINYKQAKSNFRISLPSIA